MNKIVNRFLLAGDKFRPETHLRYSLRYTLHIVLVEHQQKPKKEYKNLKKQVIHDIFIKTS